MVYPVAHIVKRNREMGEDRPPLAVERGGVKTFAREVEIVGPARMVYRPDSPRSCGARVWVEAENVVVRT